MTSSATGGMLGIPLGLHLLDAGEGGLGMQHGQHRAVQDVDMVVLQIGADGEAAVAHQRAHWQLDVAPAFRGRPEEGQPPHLPVQSCAGHNTFAAACKPPALPLPSSNEYNHRIGIS